MVRTQSLSQPIRDTGERAELTSTLPEAADSQARIHDMVSRNTAGFSSRYTSQQLVGRGGSAAIYRAIDQQTGAPVALKLLLPTLAHDRTARGRIRREGALLREYQHASLPSLIAELPEPIGLVLEYIVGVPLSQAQLKLRHWCAPAILPIYDGLLTVLAFLHEQGVVHRDIKPSNILLPIDSQDGAVVKLIDWGLAARVNSATTSEKLTRSGIQIGTPLYMSPEHCQGRGIHQKSDVYCLGLVLFEMLTGYPPFSGSTPVGVMMSQLTQPLPKWPGTDSLAKFLYGQACRMTSKEPGERPTMSMLQNELRPYLLQL